MAEPIILASASPRRHELLRQIGVDFEAYAPDVDENVQGEPAQVVCALAERKALAALALYPGRVILGADTLVYAKGETLGKPRDGQDALRMLRLLQGDWHEVYSGVCVIDGTADKLRCRADVTRVRFIPMQEQVISAYVASGEPFGKAGAYAVQGLAGQFVCRLEGSSSNVIGLPLHLVRELLQLTGIKVL